MTLFTPVKSSDSDPDSRRMEVIYFSNEFPQEDLSDLFRHLHNHAKDRNHPLLAKFIEGSTWAIRDEIARLPTALQRLIDPLETILGWAENDSLRRSEICAAVEGVLLVVLQLGTYIG